MNTDDFCKQVTLKITVGHLLLAWQVMTDKFSSLQSFDTLSEDERRAIWGLSDLLERALIDVGVSEYSQAGWEALVREARTFINAVPVDFLE